MDELITWQRASYCGAGTCVEAHIGSDTVLVRDSKQPERELAFDHDEWQAFVAGVKAGEFDG